MTLKIAEDKSHKGASFMEIRDLIIYALFISTIGMFTLGVYTQNSFHLNNAVANVFIFYPYHCEGDRTDVTNVSSVGELWCYLNQRFIVALEEHPFWGTIGTQNETFLLRQPRIRQVRVVEEECIVPVSDHGCYGIFSAATEEKEPFNLANDTAWVYSAPSDGSDVWFTGKVSTYNSAGYYFTLTSSTDLAFYEKNEWIDKQTRAIFIDFTFYNINVNLFCVCQILFELPPSGGIIPSFQFSSVKLIRYNDRYDHFVLACEIVFVMFCTYYSIEIVYDFMYFRQRFFKMRDNYIDALILVLSWTSVWVLIYRYVATISVLDSGDVRSIQELPDYQRLKSVHLTAERYTAVTLFCALLKLYRFIHYDTISHIYTTLQYCMMDMLSFCILFFIILFAYAELGTLLFSGFVESYRSLKESFFTLLRMMMGEFHYQEITGVLHLLGPIYIVSFVMFVVFLLLNMFLAILNATYSVVSSNVKVTRKSEYVPFIKHCIHLRSKKFESESSEKSQKMKNSSKITLLMKRSGFSELEIDTFFSRYTVDDKREIPDGVFQRVVHSNVGLNHLVKLKSRTNIINLSVTEVVKKKNFFLKKISRLMRR